MMRRLAALAATFLALASTPAARADFVVNPDPPAIPGQIRPGPGVVADIPHADPGDRKPRAGAPAHHQLPPMPIVQGFGDEIPLAFACRQILPASVKVEYGAGADPRMVVSWKGGDTWPHVLAAAIKPLGLHMQRSGSTVKIES